jgi:hypothetical protein
VSSARAIGKFAVQAGQHEFLRRSSALRNRITDADRGPVAGGGGGTDRGADGGGGHPVTTAPDPETDAVAAVADLGPARAEAAASPGPAASTAPTPASSAPAPAPAPAPPAPDNGHVPAVASLSIPGFDTLSASQVVQRLDGLNRSELVSVRAYEASTRGRRTILSRVDQLLDERS